MYAAVQCVVEKNAAQVYKSMEVRMHSIVDALMLGKAVD